MPRAPVAGREIRRRSRNGCWNCKARKVKCGEEKPRCSNCERLDEDCDYKIRLSWGGRPLKKKLMENGGSQDQNGDDQSQFIPGAGQFSISQHFPTPQTFVQTAPPSGSSRKPPVPRLGNGKKANSMSTYQTVFAIGETPTTTPTQTSPPTSAAQPQGATTVKTEPQTPLQPPIQLNVHIPPTPQASLSRQQNDGGAQRRPSGFGWQAAATANVVSPTGNFDSGQMDTDLQDRPFFSPYTPTTAASFSTQVTAPPTAFHSPPTARVTSSPDIPYERALGSPQEKAFHPPPPLVTSPSKRVKTSTSPTQPPPNSPFIYGRHVTSGPPIRTSLAEAIDYLGSPVTSAPMVGMTELQLEQSAISLDTPDVMRRVSVENLLAGPIPTTMPFPAPYDNQYATDMDGNYKTGFKQESTVSAHTMGNPAIEDDIEEIERPDLGYNGGFQDLSNAQGLFRLNSAYPGQLSIPRRLDPLPQLLLDNSKNMMYFHHFLHYTSRLLVPHDCSENPFKHILPQMAVKTDHLMNLLLAYSASHRARLLDHPEPTERIGSFIDETIRSLTVALSHRDHATSDASLATALMLASHQIISPNPFAVSGLTWRTHLDAARKIIVQRGGAQGMHSHDTVSYFLVRWFAYLDLIGRLSSREIDEPISSGKYWTNDNENEEEEYTVNCFFGFTTRCVSILAKIGELARRCGLEKKEAMALRSGLVVTDNSVHERILDWEVPAEIRKQAQELRDELTESRSRSVGRCSHEHDYSGMTFGLLNLSHSADPVEEGELLAVNEAFHYTAELHLFRRVLGCPVSHPDVQGAVRSTIEAIAKVGNGGPAEACILPPLFTAGCEAIDFQHQEYVLQRMTEIEKTGLTQFKNARILMEKVWREGLPWWELVDGEFLG